MHRIYRRNWESTKLSNTNWKIWTKYIIDVLKIFTNLNWDIYKKKYIVIAIKYKVNNKALKSFYVKHS